MSENDAATTESDLEDFMDGIGLDVKPTGPEDALMIKLTGGGFNELHLLRYWLMHNLHEYYDLLENGILYMKMDNNTRLLTKITIDDYAILRIKYYLQMKYHPYFCKDVAGLGIANIDTMAQMVLAAEPIRTMVDKKHADLPKLAYA